MKVLKIFVILFIILAGVAYLGYTVYVPNMVTSSIETGEIPSIVPKKYHPKIKETRDKVNKEIEKLPEVMNKYQLSYDELLAFAQEVKNDEVLDALEEIKKTNITDSGEAFDIAMKHIDAELPQSGKVRQVFREKIPADRINEEVVKMGESELPLSVEVDLARRIGIQLLKNKRDEIENRLEQLRAN